MTVYLKHKITGKIDAFPDNYLTHPVFSASFDQVTKDEYDHNGCTDCGLSAVEDEPDVVEQTGDVPANEQWVDPGFKWPAD